jgi:hypothetical protein
LHKLFLISSLSAATFSLQAASLEHTVNQQLQAQLPLSGAGIEADIRLNEVVLSGSALSLKDRVVAETVAKQATRFAVVNEIEIDDAYLNDGF